MSWMFCGKNRNGVDIGYGVVAECDERGCHTVIDRGLAYLCGTMHDDPDTCAGYYCVEHRTGVPQRCSRCQVEEEEEDDGD